MERIRIAIPALPEGRIQNYLDAFAHLGAAGTRVEADCDPGEYDGLLMPGGCDCDPALYHQADVACRDVDRRLDCWQLKVLDAFVRAGKPVLGTCRGHQMINVYFGGSLIQHLPSSAIHSRDPGSSADKAHPTRAVPGCWLDDLYGVDFTVNSAHHQAVDALGPGLEIVQWSSDGVIEAMHHTALPVWGVQWHPERMCFEHRRDDTVDGARLFEMFLARCAEGRR